MNNQKPKDCICGFPLKSRTNHQEYCPSYKRILKKRKIKAEHREYWSSIYAKDAYGRWVAGVGPKPEGIDE